MLGLTRKFHIVRGSTAVIHSGAIFAFFVGIMLANGCSRQMAGPMVPVIRPKVAPKIAVGPASLWPSLERNNWSMIRDHKALGVDDIVLVEVVTSTSAEESAKTDTSRKSDIEAKIENFLGLEQMIPMVIGGTPVVGTALASMPLIKSDSSANFSGDASTSRSGKVTARVSCIVTQVYANGNLRIFGTEGISVNHERSILTIEGIIRPADISSNNTISSTRIADARIEYTGRGVISDVQKPGFMMRAFASLWPF